MKLTREQAADVLWWYKHTSLSDEAIGKRFGVSTGTVAKIIAGNYRTAEEYKSWKPPSIDLAHSLCDNGVAGSSKPGDQS